MLFNNAWPLTQKADPHPARRVHGKYFPLVWRDFEEVTWGLSSPVAFSLWVCHNPRLFTFTCGLIDWDVSSQEFWIFPALILGMVIMNKSWSDTHGSVMARGENEKVKELGLGNTWIYFFRFGLCHMQWHHHVVRRKIMHVYMCEGMSVCIVHMHVCEHMSVCMGMCMYCACIYGYVCMCMYVCVCMHMYMHMCVCVSVTSQHSFLTSLSSDVLS